MKTPPYFKCITWRKTISRDQHSSNIVQQISSSRLWRQDPYLKTRILITKSHQLLLKQWSILIAYIHQGFKNAKVLVSYRVKHKYSVQEPNTIQWHSNLAKFETLHKWIGLLKTKNKNAVENYYHRVFLNLAWTKWLCNTTMKEL